MDEATEVSPMPVMDLAPASYDQTTLQTLQDEDQEALQNGDEDLEDSEAEWVSFIPEKLFLCT